MPATSLPAKLELRHAALRAIRTHLWAGGFLEVDTPLLVPGPGLEPHIDPLSTSVRTAVDAPGARRFLITSPELAMKRLLADGADKIFQLGHVFRDGERTRRHLPEFTLLEWYRARGTLDDMIADTEALLRALRDAIGNHGTVDVDAGCTRATVAELFTAHAGVDLRGALVAMEAGDDDALPRALRSRGHVLRPGADFEDAFFFAMTELVEPRIGRDRPVAVTRWPARMAVLARTCDDDVLFAERCEIYAGGLELCNAFDELTDPAEQRRRFHDDNRARAALGKQQLPLDELFLARLGDMPRAAGNALGVDRALMLLTAAADIDDVTVPWR